MTRTQHHLASLSNAIECPGAPYKGHLARSSGSQEPAAHSHPHHSYNRTSHLLATMSLDRGIYIITNKQFQLPIGRRRVEDLSLLPKAIVVLPKGPEPSRVRRSCEDPLHCWHSNSIRSFSGKYSRACKANTLSESGAILLLSSTML